MKIKVVNPNSIYFGRFGEARKHAGEPVTNGRFSVKLDGLLRRLCFTEDELEFASSQVLPSSDAKATPTMTADAGIHLKT